MPRRPKRQEKMASSTASAAVARSPLTRVPERTSDRQEGSMARGSFTAIDATSHEGSMARPFTATDETSHEGSIVPISYPFSDESDIAEDQESQLEVSQLPAVDNAHGKDDKTSRGKKRRKNFIAPSDAEDYEAVDNIIRQRLLDKLRWKFLCSLTKEGYEELIYDVLEERNEHTYEFMEVNGPRKNAA
ncbi:uncharacterized protein N7515_001657 [Penicillium bovifimosum]|uniref:Uncharacterized protein n=1 Tax=Penicillium bovifimosum TaxID=126998 RepID=A0A9W9HAN0_9EURO|nr:uncharacterized protein N7515_001657 [Penicillium bovifimosum]KAJ5142870.1 hypothetical protein N7515_001657 [Penicillium bovifimosum]